MTAALHLPRATRGSTIARAYALLAALQEREWVSREELDAALGCHLDTTRRLIREAEAAGLVDVIRPLPGDSSSRVRLRCRRLRRVG